MSAVLTIPVAATPFTPSAHRWTCDQFHDLGDAGHFEGKSVILVDGEILDMPNPNPPHDTCVTLTMYRLIDVFRVGHFVRVQTGLPTRLDTDPVPDLAVVVGNPRDYATQHPTPPRAVLIIEVSDSSLSYDIGEKANLYAAAGILDYWVIDVKTPQLFVFRDPVADVTAPRGYRYNTLLTLTGNDTIVPLAAPAASLAVRELLP